MKIILLLVGKTTDKHCAALIDDYTSRLTHYAPFETVVIPALRNTRTLSEEQQKQAEGESLLRQLLPSDHVVLLDERGRQLPSTEFARWMQQRQNASPRRLVFVIGGPYGFSPAVMQRADSLLSLSSMTFSHQLVRVIFLEQLYRAFTILHGQPYHHA